MSLPTIRCKEGVWFKFIDYRFLWLAKVIWEAYNKRGLVPTVTSACDSQHMKGSLHYEGLGWDWRIWGVDNPKTPQDEIKKMVENEIIPEVRKLSLCYDIVYGDAKHLDHIHTEWDENRQV